MKYYLHRISHESHVSYPLLDNGLLSIGWSDFSNREFLDNVRESGIDYLTDRFYKEWNVIPKNRYSLYRFIKNMEQGDIVIVPKWQSFDVYEVLGKAEPVSEITLPDNLCTQNNQPIILKDNLLYTDDKIVDIGFIIKVKKIAENISRIKYADAALTARMKIRQTNADISDLKDSVDNAIEAFKVGKPINLKYEIVSNIKDNVLNIIKTKLVPEKLETLIKWYCEKSGASFVDIPAKNSTDKKGDADVVAIFENLKLILYIQAKFHHNETNSWAIEQINDYFENISNNDENISNNDGYSRIAWVITTADKYSDEAVKLAKERNIILINGNQFAEMLLDAGFSGMNI